MYLSPSLRESTTFDYWHNDCINHSGVKTGHRTFSPVRTRPASTPEPVSIENDSLKLSNKIKHLSQNRVCFIHFIERLLENLFWSIIRILCKLEPNWSCCLATKLEPTQRREHSDALVNIYFGLKVLHIARFLKHHCIVSQYGWEVKNTHRNLMSLHSKR